MGELSESALNSFGIPPARATPWPESRPSWFAAACAPLSLGLSQHGCHATLGETAKKAQSALGRPCRVSPSGSERMRHAYRLLYADSSSASDSLWEWHQPWIDHLLRHARTSGRQVVHRYFAPWQGLE